MEENWQEFTETTMPFSVIIPWRSGNPNREESFKNMMNCLSVQQTPASKEKITMEVIVVEHAPTLSDIRKQKTLDLIPEKIKQRKYPFVKFTYKQLTSNIVAFNKSWCMNVGARLAQFDNLVFLDADSLMGNDFIRTIKYEIRRTPSPQNSMMMLWNYLAKMNGKDDPIPRWVRPDTTRALGGIWYSIKNFYWNNFGGMNENYCGYGGEDNDGFERAIFALQRAGGVASYLSFVAYPLVHQYHDNEPQSPTVPLWVKTRANPQMVIDRLKATTLGNENSPMFINMDDLIGN